jgi:hypothetical protein
MIVHQPDATRLLTAASAVLCAVLAIAWPDWRRELRAQTTYPCECTSIKLRGVDPAVPETAGGNLEVPPSQRVTPFDPASNKALGARNTRVNEPRTVFDGLLSIGWVVEVEATVTGESCNCTHFQEVQSTFKVGANLDDVMHHTNQKNGYAANGTSGYQSGTFAPDGFDRAGATVNGAERPPQGQRPVPKQYLTVEHADKVVRWVDSQGSFVKTNPYEKKAIYHAVVKGATSECECTWETLISVGADGTGTVTIPQEKIVCRRKP